MPSSQDHINAQTPMGANLTAGGATFRVFGPSAVEVFVSGDFNGFKPQDPAAQLVKHGNEWMGFIPDFKDGTRYKFFVVGLGSTGFKRDPHAREIVPCPRRITALSAIRTPFPGMTKGSARRPSTT